MTGTPKLGARDSPPRTECSHPLVTSFRRRYGLAVQSQDRPGPSDRLIAELPTSSILSSPETPPVRRPNPHARSRLEVAPDDQRRGTRAGRAALLLVLLSFMYQSHLVPGALSHVAQGAAIIFAPLATWSDRYVKRALNYGVLFAFVSVVAITPTFFAFGIAGRFTLVLDLLANISLWLVTFALLRTAGTSWLRGFSRLCWLMIIGSVLQAGLRPIAVVSDSTRIAGIPRPLFTFSEPTWLGITSALLIAVLLTTRRTRGLLTALACLNILIFTRSALVLLFAAVYLVLRRGRAVVDSAILVLATSIGATYFTVSALLSPLDLRYVGTSLDSRLGDITAVRLANNNQLLPFGGANLSVFDPSRSRWVPTTSNNVIFDLLWKFGIGGLIVFVLWTWLLVSGFPRIVEAKLSDFLRLPAGVALLLLPAVAEINNMFRNPWIWTLSAALLAAVGIRLSQMPHDARVNGPSSTSLQVSEKSA